MDQVSTSLRWEPRRSDFFDVAEPVTISPTARLLAVERYQELVFTIDPTWLASAGTVALGVAPSSSGESKARITTRAEGKDGGWRPGSIFGGLWSSPDTLVEDKEGEEEEDDEGEGTLKGARSAFDSPAEVKGARDTSRPPKSLIHHPASAKARLSSLFTDFLGTPEPPSTSRTTPSAPIARPSTGSMRLPQASTRMSMIDFGSPTPLEYSEAADDLDSALEALMVSAGPPPSFAPCRLRSATQEELGMKEGPREEMRKMPAEAKRKLLANHRPSPSPLRPSKTGPELDGDSGALSTLKRFSLASVGWGPGALEGLSQQAARPSSIVDSAGSLASLPSLATSPPPTPGLSSAPSHPPPTASWSSWWSAASNATGVTQVSEQAKDTPKFYVDQIRSV